MQIGSKDNGGNVLSSPINRVSDMSNSLNFDASIIDYDLIGNKPKADDYYEACNLLFPNLANGDPKFPYQKYMRMYIGQFESFNGSTGTIAFSFYPSRHALFTGVDDPRHYDGVYMDYRIFDAIIDENNSDASLIVAHEVGHWFDVYHPFEHIGTN